MGLEVGGGGYRGEGEGGGEGEISPYVEIDLRS